MSFHSERNVTALRKRKPCAACWQWIEIGDPAVRWAGLTDGDFGTAIFHPECRAAQLALNAAHGTDWDEWMELTDMEAEDHVWLVAEHPVVAARMGITAEAAAA